MKTIIFATAVAATLLFSGGAYAENPSFVIWADLSYWPSYGARHVAADLKDPGAVRNSKHTRGTGAKGGGAPPNAASTAN